LHEPPFCLSELLLLVLLERLKDDIELHHLLGDRACEPFLIGKLLKPMTNSGDDADHLSGRLPETLELGQRKLTERASTVCWVVI
jgi:hypothetical protein